MFNYNDYDALGLANLIKTKAIKPDELLEAVIAKAELVNSKLNFLTNKIYDYARKAVKESSPEGIFYGVPFLLKDLGAMLEGTITTHGSNLYKDFVAPNDSEFVKRFKKSGLIIFGKTIAAEFGLSFSTEPLAFGACRNPWNLNLICGGSSGGAAAAVASRVIPVAHASDGGGSIRVPASCCGVFGLKPTRARVPMGPLFGEGWAGLATNNVISISVRDTAAMLDCISGPEIGDPYYAPYQNESYMQSITHPVKPLKIAVTTHFNTLIKPDKEVLSALQHTGKLCEQLGHTLTEATPNFSMETLTDALRLIIAGNTLMTLKLYEQSFHTEESMIVKKIEPIAWAFANYGKQFNAADYAEAITIFHQESRKIAHFFETYDILLTPTTAKLPPAIGDLTGNTSDFRLYNEKQGSFSPYTVIANITGQPAMSVPLYWTQQNIPIGSHFIGKFGAETTLLQLATQLEQAQPWFNRKPNSKYV